MLFGILPCLPVLAGMPQDSSFGLSCYGYPNIYILWIFILPLYRSSIFLHPVWILTLYCILSCLTQFFPYFYFKDFPDTEAYNQASWAQSPRRLRCDLKKKKKIQELLHQGESDFKNPCSKLPNPHSITFRSVDF